MRSLKMRQVENKIPVASANNLLKFNAVEKGARRQLTTIKRENQREQRGEKRQGKKAKEVEEEEAEIGKGRHRRLTSKAEHISHMPSDNERKDKIREERGKGEERGEKRSKRGGIRKRGKQGA